MGSHLGGKILGWTGKIQHHKHSGNGVKCQDRWGQNRSAMDYVVVGGYPFTACTASSGEHLNVDKRTAD